ncbi:MAG: hypothetical protein HQ565_12075 [Bacteroidetes bacterium]|nr:hypothetical protein [Bacteroidota bacterium]
MKNILCLIFLAHSIGLFAQSREGLIILEIKNYESKESRGQVVEKGEFVNGKPHGEWTYYMIHDPNIIYYKGYYDNGEKTGVWNNYALLPPMGYTNNSELVRSVENWKENKLFRLKMGQNNLLITIEDGLEEPYISEIRRLDEAFEHSYRRTHGKTYTPEFGESVESLLCRFIPMIRTELLKSNQKAEFKFWSLYNKLRLHEIYDSGKVVRHLSQQWEKDVLFSKEIYAYEILEERYLYMNGDPADVIEYRYYPGGDLEYMKHYKNDTIPIGRWIEFYANGEKKFQGTYVNGKRGGKWKFWDEDGNLEAIKYKNGNPQ